MSQTYTKERIKQICNIIDSGGFEPRSYSGRGMYGESCLGVDLDGTYDLFTLGFAFGDAGIEMPAPDTDGMGTGIIAYWRRIPSPEKTDKLDRSSEE